MTNDPERDIDLLTASLRADAADGHVFLQALAVKLEGALPGQVHIERGGGLFSHENPVKAIEVELGEHAFRVHDRGHGRLEGQRQRVVRGIVLKSENLSLDQWIAELAAELGRLAASSERGREALERLLLKGTA
ncbi:MAG: hypothetical protein ACR2PL_27000 [Dehalococcoidia bacterium]